MPRNVILYGGCFNPVHTGHLTVAVNTLDTINTVTATQHELWFLPSYSDDDKNLESAEDRMNMLNIAVDDILLSNIFVSPFEIEMANSAGTYAVVKALKKAYPTINFKYLIGLDQAVNIRGWRNSRGLTKEIPFVIAPRAGYFSFGQPWYISPPHICITSAFSPINMSSTGIRLSLRNPSRRYSQEFMVNNGLPVGVYQYIVERGLYAPVETEAT